MADGKGIFGKIMEHVTPNDHHNDKGGEEHGGGGLIGNVMDRIHHKDQKDEQAASESAPQTTDSPSSAPTAPSAPATPSTPNEWSAPSASNEGRVSESGVSRMYTTRAGDTLEAIAAFFYGDPAQRQRLLDDNPGLGALQPGATLSPGTNLHVGEDVARGDTVKGTV